MRDSSSSSDSFIARSPPPLPTCHLWEERCGLLGDISILWRTTISPTLSPILLVLLQIHVTHCGLTCSLYGEVGNESVNSRPQLVNQQHHVVVKGLGSNSASSSSLRDLLSLSVHQCHHLARGMARNFSHRVTVFREKRFQVLRSALGTM